MLAGIYNCSHCLQGIPKNLPTFKKKLTKDIFSLEIHFRYFCKAETCSNLVKYRYFKTGSPCLDGEQLNIPHKIKCKCSL